MQAAIGSAVYRHKFERNFAFASQHVTFIAQNFSRRAFNRKTLASYKRKILRVRKIVNRAAVAEIEQRHYPFVRFKLGRLFAVSAVAFVVFVVYYRFSYFGQIFLRLQKRADKRRRVV